MGPGILTLTTDFGAGGPYVAAIKGVVLGLAPGATLVDVSHTIAPQNILEGAFVLSNIMDAFPPGTVHLAVIDPGVGMERRLVAVQVAEQWFVAPDNGLLGGVVRGREVTEMREITNTAIHRSSVSATFHGRDILAPAAAHLLLSRPASELGEACSKVISLANFEPRIDDRGVVGEVIFRDAFGNLITNVASSLLEGSNLSAWSIEIAGHTIHGLNRTYGERPAGSMVAVPGSSGWIEIAIVNGDAARTLTAGPGMTVWFRHSKVRDRPSPMTLGIPMNLASV